jgi:Ca-activated chloride channel family protein
LFRTLLIAAFPGVAITGAAGQTSASSLVPLSADKTCDQQPISENSAAIKLSTNLVSVAVTITDRDGRAIAGLQRENFRIYDNKKEQTITFFSEEDAPASIAIIFDTSSSMSGQTIERAKEALALFIQTSHPQDEFSLIGFGSHPYLLLDKTRDGQAVLDKLTYVPTGDTALYDAMQMGLNQLSRGAYSKRAVILISDGEENNSRSSSGQLNRRLEESGAVAYTVRVGRLPLPKSIAGMVMDQIARVSGGRSFWPDNSRGMNEAFDQIALELRRQYSIGYLPTNFVADGKLHKVKVVLDDAGKSSGKLIVRSREGYYAIPRVPDE